MKTIKGSNRLLSIFQYAVCALMLFVIAVPIYIAIMGGGKTMADLQTHPASLPEPFMWNQYLSILTGTAGRFWTALLNSVILAAGTVGLLLVTAGLAAYALARLRFRGNALFYQYFQLGLLFPLAVAILPLYLQLRSLGLLDKYIGVILPQVAFQLPMQIMLIRGFMKAIPNELEEAAAIDGYGHFGFLFKIVVPLSTPVLATAGVLTLVGSWNNFFTPLLVFNNAKRFPLPMGVMDFMGQYAAGWNMILAYLTLAMIPAVLIYIFFQKYIVAGLTGGAVKG